MNVLVYFLLAVFAFIFASRYYAKYIAKTIGEDSCHPTPSQTINDGRDYVPSKR